MRQPRAISQFRTDRCQNFSRILADYFDGDLPREMLLQLERHVQRCKTCECVIKTLRKTISLYKGLPAAPLPPHTRERLDRFLQSRCTPKNKRPRRTGASCHRGK